jgi:hypothetical protein
VSTSSGAGHVAALHQLGVRVVAQVRACPRVAHRGVPHGGPVRPAQQDRVGRAAPVRGAAQHVRARRRRDQPGHRRRGDAGQVDEVHQRGVGLRARAGRAARPARSDAPMPVAQSAASTTCGPAGSTARTSAVAAPEHDDQRCAAAVGQHPQGAADERLAVQLHERLGAAHAPPRARSEEETGGYRLISVTGCT